MLAHNSPEDFLRSVEDAKVERRRQKEAELALETRLLQPWERYRALVDHYDSLQDAAEHGDRKTRFALLILGSLNAINLVVAMRGETIGLPQSSGPLVIGYLALYAMLSLGCCFCAIAALRPRANGKTPRHGAMPTSSTRCNAFTSVCTCLLRSPPDSSRQWRGRDSSETPRFQADTAGGNRTAPPHDEGPEQGN